MEANEAGTRPFHTKTTGVRWAEKCDVLHEPGPTKPRTSSTIRPITTHLGHIQGLCVPHSHRPNLPIAI